VLVTAGIDGTTGRSVPTAELYDPTTNTWAAAASMVGRRYDHTATLLADGHVLVVGGNDSSQPLAAAAMFDPVVNRWSSTNPMTTARSTVASILLKDGRVLAIGGVAGLSSASGGASQSLVGDALSSGFVSDPRTDRWLPATPMAQGRVHHSASLLLDGRILVAGG
jgi:hypothetical protein